MGKRARARERERERGVPHPPPVVEVNRFKAEPGVGVSGVGCQVSGLGCRISGLGSRVSGFGFRVSGLGSRVSGYGPGFRVPGLGFRVSCFGFRLSRHLVNGGRPRAARGTEDRARGDRRTPLAGIRVAFDHRGTVTPPPPRRDRPPPRRLRPLVENPVGHAQLARVFVGDLLLRLARVLRLGLRV